MPPAKRPPKPCSVDGCDQPARGHGWCRKHYARWAHHGHTGLLRTPRMERREKEIPPGQHLAARFTDLRLAVEQAAALLEMAEHVTPAEAVGYRDEARAVLARARGPSPIIVDGDTTPPRS